MILFLGLFQRNIKTQLLNTLLQLCIPLLLLLLPFIYVLLAMFVVGLACHTRLQYSNPEPPPSPRISSTTESSVDNTDSECAPFIIVFMYFEAFDPKSDTYIRMQSFTAAIGCKRGNE